MGTTENIERPSRFRDLFWITLVDIYAGELYINGCNTP